MGQTNNYGFPQWDSWDLGQRSQWNAVWSKADTMLGKLQSEKAQLITGVYTGDGTDRKFVDLGFTPAAVLIVAEHSKITVGDTIYGGLLLRDHPIRLSWQDSIVLEVTENGFYAYTYEVTGSNGYTNVNHMKYSYVAVYP